MTLDPDVGLGLRIGCVQLSTSDLGPRVRVLIIKAGFAMEKQKGRSRGNR
jgi:hypothetical protein